MTGHNPFDEETQLLLADDEWRINNLYSILDKNGQIIPFEMNVAQQEFYNTAHGRDIILKSRQWGFTTLCVIIGFDSLTTTPHFYSLFIAHKKEEADAILKNKIPILWENWKVKDHIPYTVQVQQAGEFRIGFDKKDDSVNSFIKSSLSGVSGTYHFMHISELSLIERINKGAADEIIRGTGAVPYDGRIVIESTGRGAFGTFHDMFMEALDRTNSGHKLLPTEYKAHFFNWFKDPEIQKITYLIPTSQMKEPEFFEKTMRDYNLNLQQINWFYSKYVQLKSDKNLLLSEYPRSISDAFRASGNSYFNQELIDMHPTRQPIAIQGAWKFYAKRIPTHQYTLGADPAGGKGGDNATIIVIDCTIGEVVAEYCSKFTPPAQLGMELDKYGRLYNNGLVIPESNNHGHAVILQLKHMNYPNIFARVAQRKYDDSDTEELGFLTSSLTKPAILSSLSEAVNTFALRIPSDTIKAELMRYPREEVDLMHSTDETGHWDRTMALAIAWHGRQFVGTTTGSLQISG